MGLLQNALEDAGFTTVSVTMKPYISAAVRAPRMLHIRFPLGNAFGMPFAHDHQTAVLSAVLRWLELAEEPGKLYRLPFRWRRME